MRARWYDPQTAAFITRDPIGHDSGETNLYRYAGGDPVNQTDPTGLCPWCVVGAVIVAKAAVAVAIDLGTQAIANIVDGCGPFQDINLTSLGMSAALGVIVPGGGSAAKGATGGLDDLARAAAGPGKGGQSAAGHALQKHGGRPGSVYPRITSPAERSRVGQELVEDYLTHPQARERIRRDGVRIFELPDGRGVSFRPDGSLRGFLEPRG
jgi:uncharacterized protein RhaS with RHS repeats